MNDTISRQDSIRLIENTPYDWSNLTERKNMINKFKALPSAEKTGKWILAKDQIKEDTENGNYRYVCSECDHSDIHAKTQEVPYCWHCGARMVGDTE